MAQTKRKRRTKHRGNAAGKVEVRGRTGRPPTAEERKQAARAQRMQRFDRPPTWRSAINRAAIATVLFIVAVMVVFRQNVGAALGIGAMMFVLYIPLGYYTDAFIYRRRQAKKAADGRPKAKV
jgi:Flp pilus assembly protein TadB